MLTAAINLLKQEHSGSCFPDKDIHVLLYQLNDFLFFTFTHLLSLFKYLFSQNNLILFVVFYSFFCTHHNSFKTQNFLCIMEGCETEEGSAATFLTTCGFIQGVLPYARRKRLGGWGSSLPHFDINQRSSQPFVSVFHILGFCVKCHQEGKREGKEGWRKEGKMGGRKKTNELESLGMHICLCVGTCMHMYHL